jgi:hypothetical protein
VWGDDRLSAEDYRARLATLEKQNAQPHRDVAKALKANSVAEIRAGLTRYADANRQLGESVADLKPPADAEQANAQLAQGFQDVAEQISAVEAKLSGITDPKAALKLVIQSLGDASGGREIDQALSGLEELGYTTAGRHSA